MLYSAHQSSFLPWLGLWKKVYNADIFDFSIYDQFTAKTWQHYSYIKSQNGGGKQKRGLELQKPPFWTIIKDVKIHSINVERLLADFYSAHKSDPYFEMIFPLLSDWLFSVKDLTFLWEVNQILFHRVFSLLGLNTICFNAPKIEKSPSLDILRNTMNYWCSVYLSWPHWKNYLEAGKFRENSIQVLYLDTSEDFKKYPYSIVSLCSMYGVPFVSNLVKEKITFL